MPKQKKNIKRLTSRREHNGVALAAHEDAFDVALPLYYATTPNLEAYRKLVELGAEAGDPLAQYAMATWFLFGNVALGVPNDPSRAVELLACAAKTLNRAMYDLAICKLRGYGTRRDDKAAFRLLVRAAALGSLPAMEAQAYCLGEGIGIRKNRAAARRVKARAGRLIKGQQRIVSRP